MNAFVPWICWARSLVCINWLCFMELGGVSFISPHLRTCVLVGMSGLHRAERMLEVPGCFVSRLHWYRGTCRAICAPFDGRRMDLHWVLIPILLLLTFPSSWVFLQVGWCREDTAKYILRSWRNITSSFCQELSCNCRGLNHICRKVEVIGNK